MKISDKNVVVRRNFEFFERKISIKKIEFHKLHDTFCPKFYFQQFIQIPCFQKVTIEKWTDVSKMYYCICKSMEICKKFHQVKFKQENLSTLRYLLPLQIQDFI